MSGRTWIGEALAAFDQSLGSLPQDGTFPPSEFWLQRAGVAASIAQAEQARIANLIAWKQLRQTQPATALPGAGDAITAEIEDTLGITEPGDRA
jgi:hypothetical protein